MDAIMLVVESVGMILVLRWVATRRGDVGLFAWKADPPAKARKTGVN